MLNTSGRYFPGRENYFLWVFPIYCLSSPCGGSAFFWEMETAGQDLPDHPIQTQIPSFSLP